MKDIIWVVVFYFWIFCWFQLVVKAQNTKSILKIRETLRGTDLRSSAAPNVIVLLTY